MLVHDFRVGHDNTAGVKSQTDRDRHKSSRDLSAGSTPRSGSDANRYPPKLMVQEKIQPMDERETCVLTETE